MMLADLRFAISAFSSQTDNAPKLGSVSWADLVAKLTPSRPPTAPKDRRPAWSPATYPAGSRRSNATVVAVSLLVADVDDGTDPERVLSLFEGHARLVHTSWSHQREKRGQTCARCRLVVPFATPVHPDQWERVWRGAELVAARAGITIDSAVDSPSELYFLPCLRDDDQPWWFGVVDGEPLDWRALPEAPAKEKAKPPPASSLPFAGDAIDKRIAGMVRVKCDEISRAPSRHEALLAAARYVGGLCARYQVDPDQHAAALIAAAGDSNDAVRTCRDGLAYGAAEPVDLPPDRPLSRPNREDSHADWDGDTSAALIPSWLSRLKAGIDSGDVDALKKDREVALGVVRPLAHAGEVEILLGRLPHAERAALKRIGRQLVMAERTARKAPRVAAMPLIVQHGQTWWVLDGDRYLAVEARLVATEVARLTAAAGSPVDTLVTTESGARRMTPVEIYDAHGVTARRLRWTYDASGPAWDEVERVLDVPGARVRRGGAARSELVEGWLDQFVAESQQRTFLDWLATATRLDRPTSSPQLRGPDSAGKAMLVSALATLLGGRTDYAHATDDFNAGLIFGPLVILDEGVAESRPDAFRRLTGNREHQVCAKNRMPEELVGCPRVVVTSNEPDPLRLGREELSSQSEHALGRRILVFDVQPAAAEYLAFIGGWDTTHGWAEPDGELVCHLRWLAETREVTPGRRFLVEGDAAEWVASSHLRVGVAGDLVQAYLAYEDLIADARTAVLAEPSPFHFYTKHPDMVGINVGGLQANWQRLVGDAKTPTNQRLGAALRRLSGQEEPVRPDLDSRERGPRVYLVNQSKLRGG